MARGGAQAATKAVVTQCGIKKKITVHSLRHYAEFLIMPTPFVMFSHSEVISVC
jgi:hypothetical protein